MQIFKLSQEQKALLDVFWKEFYKEFYKAFSREELKDNNVEELQEEFEAVRKGKSSIRAFEVELLTGGKTEVLAAAMVFVVFGTAAVAGAVTGFVATAVIGSVFGAAAVVMTRAKAEGKAEAFAWAGLTALLAEAAVVLAAVVGAIKAAVAGAGAWAAVGAVGAVVGAGATAWVWAMAANMTIAVAWAALGSENSKNHCQTSSILVRDLPEDSRAYLHELRRRWSRRGDSKWRIELKTNLCALNMHWGNLRSRVESIRFPFNKKS
jgi:hypothetical protein